MFFPPERTIIDGNYTSYQYGKVCAAEINLDAVAAVSPNQSLVVRVKTEGYDYFEVDLKTQTPIAAERGTMAALVRGIATRIHQLGHNVTGFDAYITSNVLPGEKPLSLVDFEILIGTIINNLDSCGLNAVEIVQVGQYVENMFF